MANTIKIRRSGVPGKQPDSLAIGELGLNYADGVLYFKVIQSGVEKLFRLVAQEVGSVVFDPNFGLITEPVATTYDYGALSDAVTTSSDYGAL